MLLIVDIFVWSFKALIYAFISLILFLGLIDFVVNGNVATLGIPLGLIVFAHFCRTYNKPKLEIELVPAPMAGMNARAVMTYEQWKEITSICHKEHRYHCACCGITRVVLECHEVWDYSENTMRLAGLQSLCHECHMSKHILFAKRELKVPYKKILKHIKKVYGVGSFALAIHTFFAKRQINKITEEIPLDLTFLNHSKFNNVHMKIKRPVGQYNFTKNENKNCAKQDWRNYS